MNFVNVRTGLQSGLSKKDLEVGGPPLLTRGWHSPFSGVSCFTSMILGGKVSGLSASKPLVLGASTSVQTPHRGPVLAEGQSFSHKPKGHARTDG